MTEYGISIIFHYDGEFIFDIIRLVYNGGRQKLRSLSKSLTYGMLLNEVIALSNWDANIEDVSVKYLHHNGLVFSLISLEDENDIGGMLMASRSEQDGLHVYVNMKLHAVNKKREGSRERVKVGGLSAWKKMCKGICEIINPTLGLIYPTMDIREDVDIHFSSALDSHTTDHSTRTGFACSLGSYEEFFKILHLYCRELHMTNSGIVTNIDTTIEDMFRKFFWA